MARSWVYRLRFKFKWALERSAQFGVLLLIFGVGTNHVLLINHTGLKIVRIIIDQLKIEETQNQLDQILVEVSPQKHDMSLVFKGGAHIDWKAFDFRGVRQITFSREKNRVNATYE